MFKYLFFLLFFITSCTSTWHMNGVFYEGEEVVRWAPEDFPLVVTRDDSIDKNDETALIDAIAIWNSRVGQNVFVYIPRNETWGEVHFRQSDIQDVSSNGITQAVCWRQNNGWRMSQAVITIDISTPTEDSVIVLVHELGHALALEHDSYRGSVMYGSAADSGGRILSDDRRFVLWQMNQ